MNTYPCYIYLETILSSVKLLSSCYGELLLFNRDLHAFIWDSPRLRYEATKSCDLVTAGDLFGRSSYGIAFKKNSHWTERFSHKILSYHEGILFFS